MPKTSRQKKIVKTAIPVTSESDIPQASGPKRPWKHIILIAILLVGAIFWKFKGQFIAAVVNGQPVSRWQLNDQLQKKYGNQVLESLINERLILAALRQNGIFIKSDEIDARIKQIETRLKGQLSLDEALKMQGLTRDDFKKQLEIQLSIEKYFSKDATVSSKEIDEQYKSNKDAYKNATDTAAVKADIENSIKQQKITDLFDKWFAEIQKNAKIQKFL